MEQLSDRLKINKKQNISKSRVFKLYGLSSKPPATHPYWHQLSQFQLPPLQLSWISKCQKRERYKGSFGNKERVASSKEIIGNKQHVFN